MIRIPQYSRILLLAEGGLGVFTSKTAASLLRYRSAEVVGVIDSAHAGRPIREIIPWSPPVPIHASIATACAARPRPEALFVGVAPVGGRLPGPMRRHVLDAVRSGLDVVSGMHQRLTMDAGLVAAARAGSARLIDVRVPPEPQVVASARARELKCRRVLTVGTDCNVGKMVASLELHAAAQRRGLRSVFVASGQTGIMIDGQGVPVDCVVSDFAAGAIEQALLELAADADICLVEGQGSLGHPGFSGVTLSLMHGACPDAFILVHHAGRTHYLAEPHLAMPPLARVRAAYEQVAELVHPATVVGVALNAHGVPPAQAADEARRIERELNLPVQDPIRDGCEILLDRLVGGRC